jgi:hypothetical protein
MTQNVSDLFEARLRSVVRGALDNETGPHPAWADSPAARRVAEQGSGRIRRLQPGGLRLLAFAAVLAVGGTAAAGSMILSNQHPQLPLPTPAPAIPATSPTPRPLPTPAPPALEDIAFVRDNIVYIRGEDGVDSVLPARANFTFCPQYLADGRLAVGETEEPINDATSWRIAVYRFGSDHNDVDLIAIDEAPNQDGVCFEVSPDGQRFAYVSPSFEDGGIHLVDRLAAVTDITLPQRPMTSGFGAIRWSKDGSQLAIVRQFFTGASTNSEVWLWDREHGTVRRLLDSGPDEAIDSVDFSPSGDRLSYRGTFLEMVERTEGNSIEPVGTYVRTVTLGGDESPLTLDELRDPDFTMGAGPAWSVDGSQLAWVLGGELRIGLPSRSAWSALPPVSSDVLGIGYATAPIVWSPDGRQILVGELDAPFIERGVQTSLVVYDIDSAGQPTLVQPWRIGGFGRVTWEGGSE